MSLRSLTPDADWVISKTHTRQHKATSTALRSEAIILRAIRDFSSHEKNDRDKCISVLIPKQRVQLNLYFQLITAPIPCVRQY